ncbi:MAG: Rne/Rng family ribonuclease [Bacteroidetes bacterium]|nr:Rne/Rng family ribonuclease [Bacteroidota bacterium]MBU1680782.1 Rne/Rng family ribonuclease [Bacteroidota bacterium]
MYKEIIINSTSSQNRVAITEEGILADYFVDHPEKRRMVGNIYFGRVARVLPGIRAAFVDIGLKHDAFLHFSDIGQSLDEMKGIFDYDDEFDSSDEDVKNGKDTKLESQGSRSESKPEEKERSIHKVRKGDEILVQIIKEPVKDKGVRVSSAISIPGRFCVLLPFDGKIGISKKIMDHRERRRLRKLARSILPENCGLIIRTAAKEQDEDALSADLKFLVNTWKDIQEKVKNVKPPSIVFTDLSTTVSVIRDLFTPDVSKVFIDSKKLFKEIRDYVAFIQEELVEKVNYYKNINPIFEEFKIEEQIKGIMSRKVQLPSGGYIIIEHTEAMAVIDVNSGKYAAKKEQELNSLKTDLEATREIVRQLRLRDIGGLIVIDFIDLEEERNRKKIYDEFKKEFKKDRAKIALLPMTEFGIMQITRQRVRENILQSVNDVCPYCEGTGLLAKKSHLIHEIEDWIKRLRFEGKKTPLVLKVHPSLGSRLKSGKISTLTKLRFKYLIRIKLEEDEKINLQTFQILSAKTGEDLTEEFS